MAETRSKTLLHLIGEPACEFDSRLLPTSTEVLKVYFYHRNRENSSPKDAVSLVVQQISEIWEKARVPTREKRSIVRQLQNLISTYRNVCRNKKRASVAQFNREANFVTSISCLFDIAHHEAEIIKIEEDLIFLKDQRSDRRYVMGGVDKVLEKNGRNKELKSLIEYQRVKREEERKRKAEETITLEDAFSSSTDDESQDECFAPVSSSVIKSSDAKRRIRRGISQDLTSALDRTNVSSRKAAYILAEAIKTFGEKGASAQCFSPSTIRRARIKHRATHSTNVKSTFCCDGPLVVHFDGKLLPAISGCPRKEERMAILVTGQDTEKLLGVPSLSQSTGEGIAQAVYDILEEWKLLDQIAAMSFDTASSNTGRIKGACILLEQKAEKKLLWLACRHHVLEVLCGDVFKAIFGATCGPNVPLFRRFQENWNTIDQTKYQSCSDSRLNGELKTLKTEVIEFAMNILQDKEKNLPREDYRELLELTVIFLGEVPPRGVSFRVPGAFHHARWMSKLLYVFKIVMFQGQFHLTQSEIKKCLEFAMFAALIYVKYWISCPSSCDAPFNDLQLLKALTDYKQVSEIVSTKAITAINRHLWYLGEELSPLSLFSDLVTSSVKLSIAARLKETASQNCTYRSTKCDATDNDLSNATLDSFIGPASHFFFTALNLDKSFLDEDVVKWPKLFAFQQAKKTVKSLKVVNDSAERGIALATTFNSCLTKQEEQKQYLLQVVESHRKKFPNSNTSTLHQSQANY